jgi:hypothetical protein
MCRKVSNSRLRRSKNDQEGAGRVVAIPYGHRSCPVRSLRAWLAESGITSGALFPAINRHGRISFPPCETL